MAELLKAESSERQVHALANQMKAARFPIHRDLLGFDFTASLVDCAWSNACTGATSSTPARTSFSSAGPAWLRRAIFSVPAQSSSEF